MADDADVKAFRKALGPDAIRLDEFDGEEPAAAAEPAADLDDDEVE